MINICKYAFNEVNLGHQWMVDWKPIRDMLALGEDKHEYFREINDMQIDDDHTLEKARQWMLDNNFNAFSEDFVEIG